MDLLTEQAERQDEDTTHDIGKSAVCLDEDVSYDDTFTTTMDNTASARGSLAWDTL